MKSTTYFKNYKILIVTLLILFSLAFSNKFKSQAPEIGEYNDCYTYPQNANGHYNKHVSECYNYNLNHAGKAIEGPQEYYNGQTIVTKAALDTLGNLVPDSIAIVKLGKYYFEFKFKGNKLRHIGKSLNKDYTHRLFNEDFIDAATVKECPLNENYKIEKALPKLNNWCINEWTSAKNDIPIPNRSNFKTICRSINIINGFPNDIRGVVNDKCVLVGCFRGLQAPVRLNLIEIDGNTGRNALNDRWTYLKGSINLTHKCNQ